MKNSTPFELDSPSTNSIKIFTILTPYPKPVKMKSKLLPLSCSQDNMEKMVIHTHIYTPIYKLLNKGWFWVLGVMIGEDLQKISGKRVMRTIAIDRVPIRNLPNRVPLRNLPNRVPLRNLPKIEWKIHLIWLLC
ncbi:hypothetical protein AVEN_87267-1 [Araneus ventricosus]|uniref:Uncharacterized protein n=1 Tax=Araneus ventricosus TaxID=182803 RepID=A0A4Y2EAK9_ARAVE|nr:hypothetical protein AVEN_87267-1 [Araneus ventricosus]